MGAFRTVAYDELVIFGRDAEAGTLTELLDRAAGGHGGAAVLRGAAGIGKTTLLR